MSEIKPPTLVQCGKRINDLGTYVPGSAGCSHFIYEGDLLVLLWNDGAHDGYDTWLCLKTGKLIEIGVEDRLYVGDALK